MKIQVTEAQGPVLDWLVAKCEGHLEPEAYLGKLIPRVVVCNQTICDEWVVRFNPTPQVYYSPLYNPSTSWDIGGPIIERELLQVNPHFLSAGYERPEGLWEWEAYVLGPTNIDDNSEQHGPTPLIAAMRCYVTSKLGEEVEVPDELVKG